MSENEEANSHQQRMSAQKVEEIHPLPENIFLAVLFYNSPKEISEDVDENPRDYRKVVGRAETAVGKADEGYIFELIEKVRQVEQLDKMFENANSAVELIIGGKIDRAMNMYN